MGFLYLRLPRFLLWFFRWLETGHRPTCHIVEIPSLMMGQTALGKARELLPQRYVFVYAFDWAHGEQQDGKLVTGEVSA